VKLRPISASGAPKTGAPTIGQPVRTPRRGALAAAVGAIALALAPSASGALTPLLTATGAGSTVTLAYSQTAASDGAAILAFYAPSTYTAKLPTTVGATVGTATGTATAADVRGTSMPLDGTIRVAAAATPLVAGGSTTVGDAARACTGPGELAATWSLTLRTFDQTIPLALGVQRLTSGPMSGATAFFLCPPPADVPTGSAGRAPLGLEIVRLTLRLTGAFTVPAGTHVWHLRSTPYTPGAATPNTAGAAEAEAAHGTPGQLTLAAKPAGANRSSVSGRLTLAGKGVAGRTVRILSGGKQVGTARTNSSGAFGTNVLLEGARASLTAKAVVPARYLVPCARPAFAPIPCTTSIVSGFAASASARVR
jgi:hypothetical protein